VRGTVFAWMYVRGHDVFDALGLQVVSLLGNRKVVKLLLQHLVRVVDAQLLQ
jgi:hypothetical protein